MKNNDKNYNKWIFLIIIIIILYFIFFNNYSKNNESFINYRYGSGMPGYEILPSRKIIRPALYKGNIYLGLDKNVIPTNLLFDDNDIQKFDNNELPLNSDNINKLELDNDIIKTWNNLNDNYSNLKTAALSLGINDI